MRDMRIGILTLPLHTNYGGILQAYALQTVLERMGNNVLLIEKRNKPYYLPLLKAPFAYGKRLWKKIKGDNTTIFLEQKQLREEPIIRQYTDKFIKKYIKRKIVNDFSDLDENDFDAIVVGSDQIWRIGYLNDKIECAYLSFTEGWNVKRIAFSASFGIDKWTYTKHQTIECGKLLTKFDFISVRETAAINLCRNILGVEAKQTLDPTLLLTSADYERLFLTETPRSKGNLLCYFLDETSEKLAIADEIAAMNNLSPFRVNSKVEDRKAPLDERIQPPVEQWLRGFYDAECVVTDSFHACVFSIIFRKHFWVVGNKERGLSRITSLLEQFELNERLIKSISDLKLCNDIDWDKVISLLDNKKSDSYEFLLNALKSHDDK